MTVKVPMETYKGKPLDTYTKEQLIIILEEIWALFAFTSEEAYDAFGLRPINVKCQGKLLHHITLVVCGLGLGLAIGALINGK